MTDADDSSSLEKHGAAINVTRSKEDTKSWSNEDGAPDVLTGEIQAIHLDGSQDIAAKYIGGERIEVSPAMNRRLVMKADMYICSFMCLVYAIQFMDKVSNASASIMGMRQDLHMKGDMYSWVGSSFYLGYLVFEIPMSLLLQRLPLAKTTGVIIIIWGVVMAASGASHNYPGYIAARVVLGALEGAITPSFIALTSQWYKRNEQFSRTAVWFGCNGIGSILAGSIGYGLYERTLKDDLPIAGWRLLFVIMGVMTVVIGAAFALHIPDTPAQAWFLNEEERHLQTERIRDNKQGYGNRHIKWYQVREAFMDPRTYLYFTISLINNIPNGGVTNFQSILFKGLGFDTGDSLLLGMGGGGVEFVGCLTTAVVAMYVLNKYRMIYACSGAALTVMCLCLLAWESSNSGKLAGLMLWSWASPVSYLALLSNISSNSAGRTKKSIMSATLLIGYCVGNLIGPQTFKSSEEPTYATAKTTMAACSVVVLVLEVVLTLLNVWENRRRDRKNEKLPESVHNSEFADLTDFENPEFRYAL